MRVIRERQTCVSICRILCNLSRFPAERRMVSCVTCARASPRYAKPLRVCNKTPSPKIAAPRKKKMQRLEMTRPSRPYAFLVETSITVIIGQRASPSTTLFTRNVSTGSIFEIPFRQRFASARRPPVSWRPPAADEFYVFFITAITKPQGYITFPENKSYSSSSAAAA